MLLESCALYVVCVPLDRGVLLQVMSLGIWQQDAYRVLREKTCDVYLGSFATLEEEVVASGEPAGPAQSVSKIVPSLPSRYM
jgi:hypothetical protein